MARGKFRVYLGAAPGVGKTYAMLGEGHRRADRGTDVVVGYVECHGRILTEQLVAGLEVVPRRTVEYRGGTFTEMDVDAILHRRPEQVLVDEIAHTNVPGSRNAKRWQDVEELLDAGIDVITTVNIQHLESLNDVVEAITGVKQRETIPDEVVRRADQIELRDMAPESLRRRLAHGNVYPPEKIDAALANYFRAGNLTALRELALLWLADRVDEGLSRYRAAHDITAAWPARERVVVALTGGPEGETVLRRAARIAARGAGGELLAVHVVTGDGLAAASPQTLGRLRTLVESLGGTYHQVVGDDVPTALLDFASGVNATQLVLGSSRRNRFQHLFRPDVATLLTPRSGDIDVHLVTHEQIGKGRLQTPRTPLSRRRIVGSWILALVGPPVLTLLLAATRDAHTLTIEVLCFLALAVANALVGGIAPAAVAAVMGSLLLNYFFTPPLHTLTINETQNVVALVIFVVIAVAVAIVVDLAARRASQAVRARAEAATLSTLAGNALRGSDALESLLGQARETFGMTSAALLERGPADGADGADSTVGADDQWKVLGSVGSEPARDPGQADADAAVTDSLVLALTGRVLPASDRRVLEAFAEYLAVVLERRRLSEQAGRAGKLAEGNRIRTALLAAVSHDLRTPLAAVKAAVSSLRQTDVELSEEDQAELLAGIEESADRLDRLVANLLDMSRIQAEAVRPMLRDVSLDEVVPAALIGVPRYSVKVALPEDLPAVRVDTGLVERAVANIVENAVRHNPTGEPVLLTASALRGQVEIRVADRGPGVPDEAKDHIFEPFQRLGDAPAGTGVGLGLAVARGFAEANGGTLYAEDTPAGGLTMVLTLPACARATEDAADADRNDRTAP
ncbi:two-component system, OmpR family, sensor histidine kinase KdpD [Actinopolymorpha cephalotaxi]|uniref:histidine kinase n=1 Tax=Actinopolymorpha cephalotaxi TaxID=504797 RepID=A0A1I2YLM9_9ACTN|nr:sensor histidine kinase KdpD [Actinopolymorpha cephalotaxi]NYH86902.1 two-component system sensor histidine kinase KdpD [Actinopolymorpha cephalotaxi]SFH26440.1 two-component system, OmpR family, sensor histidine kinase KdpD [Actinopolymorpha cephalotaxi]